MAPPKESLEGFGMAGMCRAVQTWIKTRKGWDRADKRDAEWYLEEVIGMIEANESEER